MFVLSQREKNKELEAKLRDTEKKLVEEKALRESAEAKLKALRKNVKEKNDVAKVHPIAQAPASQARADGSLVTGASSVIPPNSDRGSEDFSVHAPLSRTSSSDSIEFGSSKKKSEDTQRVQAKDEQMKKALKRSDDSSRPRTAESAVTPPRSIPNSSTTTMQQQQKLRGLNVESLTSQGTTLAASNSHTKTVPTQKAQGIQTSGVASAPSKEHNQQSSQNNLSSGNPPSSTKPLSHNAQTPINTPQTNTSVNTQITPQNPFAQSAVPNPVTISQIAQGQQASSNNASVSQPNKSPNSSTALHSTQQSFADAPTGQAGEFPRPGQNQRAHSTGSQRSVPSDFDPLKPRTQPPQAESLSFQQQGHSYAQQQDQVGQLFMMDQQAMTFPIVGVATADMNNQLGYSAEMVQFQQQIAQSYGSVYDQRQQGQHQTAYQDVQQMFLVPQHQIAGVDFSHPQMMTIQQPILQLQGHAFAEQPTSSWGNASHGQPVPNHQYQQTFMNPQAPQQQSSHSRQPSSFDPLHPQTTETYQPNQQTQGPGFDPLKTQTPDMYQPNQQHQSNQFGRHNRQSSGQFQLPKTESAFRAPSQQHQQNGGDPFAPVMGGQVQQQQYSGQSGQSQNLT